MCDVLAMPPDDKRRNQGDKNQLPRVRVFMERPYQQWKSRCHSDRTERDVAEGDGDQQEKSHHAQNGFWGEQYKRSEAGGDALAAAELEPDGEQMADHGEECRRGHDELLMRSAEQHSRHQNRSQTFSGVEKQSRNPECWRFAGHVRRANVAAPAPPSLPPLQN